MPTLTRRQFVRSTAASAAFGLFAIAGTKSSGRIIGANDTIRMGIAGIGGRGQAHIDGFAGLKSQKVQVTYLIDPDTRRFGSSMPAVEQIGGNTPRCVKDIREALDDPTLDGISVATCNHWHSLITVWACQAGKDVYVEKPISHNVFEGRQCVEAARKYGCVVQHGTQQRSDPARAREIAALQTGKYGRLLVSKGYCCKPRWSIGVKPSESPPKELDFDLWLGPAPSQNYHSNLVPYNWHWFWDMGNGEIGNQGVHEMDVARWAIKDAKLPKTVFSLGGRLGYEDQGQTANMQMTVFDFDDALLVFEVRGLVGNAQRGGLPQKVLNEYYTTDGVIRHGKFYPSGGGEEKLAEVDVQVTPGGCFGSFIHAVRSRKPQDNNCDAEVAHFSSALCHLANISYRMGKPVSADKAAEKVVANPQVIETLNNLSENLKAVNVNLKDTTYLVGPQLRFDANSEQFSGDDAGLANSMLRRSYRSPFVVPQQV